jgi:hypothetical protein
VAADLKNVDPHFMEFGEVVEYTDPDGASRLIEAIIDSSMVLEAMGAMRYNNLQRTATCKSSDVEGAGDGATILHAGTTYKVISVDPDATGITVLGLSRDAT